MGRKPAVRGIEALKFKEVLLPEQELDLHVEIEGDRLRFRLEDGARLFSSGRCILAGSRRPS